MYNLYIKNANNEYIKIDTFKEQKEAIKILNYFRQSGMGGYTEKLYK